MNIQRIANDAINIVARRLIADEEGDGETTEPGQTDVVKDLISLVRGVADGRPYMGPLYQRMEEDPSRSERRSILTAALAEVMQEDPEIGVTSAGVVYGE